MRPLLVLTIALTACSGDGPVTPTTTATTTGDTGSGDTAPVQDTGYELGDMGHLYLTQNLDNGRSYAYGFFAEAITGTPNLAECAAKDVACLDKLPPDLDACVPYDPRLEFEPAAFINRFLGLQVELGPYKLDYYNAPGLEHSFYFADITRQVNEDGWYTGNLGFGWGDDDSMWQPPHEPVSDLFVPQPIELQRPSPSSTIFFPNGTRLPVEWVPTGIGEVYIRIAQEFGTAQMCRVIDDGYYEIDTDTLGFGADPEEMTISVERWTRNSVRRKGNILDLASQTSVSFTGNYFNIGNRDKIEPANRCQEAQGQAPLDAGEYWGRIAAPAYDNSLAGISNCTGEFIDGNDAIVKVEVGPKESVSAVLDMADQSASIYAVERCSDPFGTCVIGSDKSLDNAVPEFISLFNATEDPQTRYLVLDATFPPDTDPGPDLDMGIFTLDISREVLTEPPMYDSCSEANSQAVITAGNYYAEFTAFSPLLNPGTGGCTGTSMPGPEGMVGIELQPGQTLDVGVQTEGADVGIYLLRDCTDPFSTPTDVCSDVDLGFDQTENLSYTNATAAVERLTLVIDSQNGIQPYFLAINVF